MYRYFFIHTVATVCGAGLIMLAVSLRPAQADEIIAEVKTVHSQPSWIVRSNEVEMAVTQLGAHMAPVTFYRNSDQPLQPYYVSPWQDENLKLDIPVEVPLRGDFFCLPFGANSRPLNAEKHPPHGEVAGAPWTLINAEKHHGVTTLTLRSGLKIRPGKVTKHLLLVDGQNVVYSRHILEGMSGAMPMGHHPTLSMPEEPGALHVATSAFDFGMTWPELFSDPASGAYQSLAINKKFYDLQQVPLLCKEPDCADCTAFPARTGFTDALAIFKTPSATPAWMAVTNSKEGYVWFSLKDPAVLPTTVFWISNRGRHAVPWNGRNRCLGLEDVCAYLGLGLSESVNPNPLTAVGIPTAIKLVPHQKTAINYIQGVVKVTKDFNQVQTVEFGPNSLTFVSPSRCRVTTTVFHDFLWTGDVAVKSQP